MIIISNGKILIGTTKAVCAALKEDKVTVAVAGAEEHREPSLTPNEELTRIAADFLRGPNSSLTGFRATFPTKDIEGGGVGG